VQYPKYDQFPAFGDMVGGYENGGHPWQPQDTVYLRVEDPGNPVNAAFQGREFPIQDQIFQFQEPYSREKLHVLLSVDLEKSDFDPKKRHFWPARWRTRIFRWHGSRLTVVGGCTTTSSGTAQLYFGIRSCCSISWRAFSMRWAI
jgi:hypothetical protein